MASENVKMQNYCQLLTIVLLPTGLANDKQFIIYMYI